MRIPKFNERGKRDLIFQLFEKLPVNLIFEGYRIFVARTHFEQPQYLRRAVHYCLLQICPNPDARNFKPSLQLIGLQLFQLHVLKLVYDLVEDPAGLQN